ncbi:MAG: oxaloacetate decarboxylase subunit alpha [Clostridiales bacterium]|jgi:oxaloacetate decarboxylase alpha subunit|nr:oxaloacetate decarboxylase subunit alpha [Clostridiales bacterium]
MKFTDTTFRDGQQSLIATRMRIEEMRPILEKMDNAGFYSVEVWGGATFDAAMRFLKEDPWERLRELKKSFKKTKIQALFRGQNILGYKCYADDVVETFVAKAIENGVDIVRAFDALNDVRNLQSTVKAIKKHKAHAQLAICYTTSEIHTIKYFADLAKSLAGIGADSICIKDMAGLLMPKVAGELVKAIKASAKLPVQVHSHYTSGLAAMTYTKAVEAGADVIDTAMSPFALGTSQPATEVMNAVFSEAGYKTGLNSHILTEIADFLRPLREKAIASGLLNPKVLAVDIATLEYQVPGGMLSNLVSQLKQSGNEEKFYEVLKEIPRVRKDFGYPPLVTPSSQIVGTQAVMNVISGERYKIKPVETKNLVKGMYGKTPVPITEEVRKKIIGDETPITERPGSLIQPQMDVLRQETKSFAESDEDVLSYALFPQIAKDFFAFRTAAQTGADPAFLVTENGRKAYPV